MPGLVASGTLCILNEFREVTCCCLLDCDAFDKLVHPFWEEHAADIFKAKE
jgi:hypothetical protein